VLWWNRLSDHIGRKPVFLCGTLATAVCIALFGLSRSFTTLALWYVVRHTCGGNFVIFSLGLQSRFLNGALNGNIGVAKSILAEITDESNIARGFSMLPLAAGVGQVIGSGMLHKISFPSLMSGPQSFHRWHFVASPGSLARPVLTQFLV